MFRTPITALTLAVLSVVPVVAEAAVSIPIDAHANCLNTESMLGGVAKFQLAPGRYVASIINNRMNCTDSNRSCLINTVIIRGVDSSTQGSAIWGLAVKTPTVVDVPGSSNANFVAFVIDIPCSDNIGQATLRFQKAQ